MVFEWVELYFREKDNLRKEKTLRVNYLNCIKKKSVYLYLYVK